MKTIDDCILQLKKGYMTLTAYIEFLYEINKNKDKVLLDHDPEVQGVKGAIAATVNGFAWLHEVKFEQASKMLHDDIQLKKGIEERKNLLLTKYNEALANGKNPDDEPYPEA